MPDPTSGSVTGVTEEWPKALWRVTDRATGNVVCWSEGEPAHLPSERLERFDLVPVSSLLDPLQERVRELERALNEIDKQFGYCLPARYTRMIRAALSPGSLQGEKDPLGVMATRRRIGKLLDEPESAPSVGQGDTPENGDE